jgi:hypothetical protein
MPEIYPLTSVGMIEFHKLADHPDAVGSVLLDHD